MKLGNIALYVFFTLLVVPHMSGTHISTGKIDTKEGEEVWLTIFVHGIMSVQPHLSFETIFKLFHDRVENSFYAHAVKNIRTDQFFHRNQAMQEFGLQPIDKQSSYAGDASCALALLFDQVYGLKINQKPENNYYYTYGWSGLLSHTIRLRESCDFFVEIAQELQKFHSRGIKPKMRVIGYSHGGNIVLGLAQGRRNKLVNFDFHIDEAILLGIPVQVETDHYISDPLFKKIYHIYSATDRIQTIDCFSFKRFGSSKCFNGQSGQPLPSNLVQIELRMFRNTINKNGGFSGGHDKRYCFDNEAILAGRSHGLRNCSPGHCELWFFGWTHAHYRANFPLSPLPIVVVLPFILESVKEHAHNFPPQQHIVADIRPHQERLIIRSKEDKRNKFVEQFLSADQLNELKDKAREFSFKRVTYADYLEHVTRAFEKTRQELVYTLFDPRTKTYNHR
jgi:hypothetical protein